MKKISAIMSLSLASLMLMASCGTSTSNPTSASESTSDSATQSSSTAVEVNFWVTMNPTITARIKDYGEKFSKYVKTNDGVDVTVKVDYQGAYTDVMKKIVDGYSIGNTPTIVVAYPDHVAEYLTYNDNFVVNLDKYINDEKYTFGTDKGLGDDIKGTEDFIETFYEEGRNYLVDGTYSLPLQKSTELMYYNKNVVEKLLVPDSQLKEDGMSVEDFMNNLSWDDFMTLCQLVRNDIDGEKKYGNNLKVPAIYDSDGNLYITQSYQRDIPYLSYNKEEKKASVDFNNAEAKAMVKDFVTKNGFAKDKALFWTKGSNDDKYGSNAFTSGETLFSIGSTGGAGYQSKDGLKAGVCPVPYANKDRKQYVSQGVTLALLNNIGLTKEKNELATLYGWKFMKYLTTPDVNVDINLTSQGYLPVRHSAIETIDYQDFLKDAEDDLIPAAAKCINDVLDYNFFNVPVFKGSAYARDQVSGIITNALLLKTDENLNKKIDDLFADAENNVKLKMVEDLN